MVVNSNRRAAHTASDAAVVLEQLDLAYLGLFLGMRVNELVVERGRAAGFADIRDSHGYVIQHLIDTERTITDIARRMAVTQQAASKAVADLVRLGLVDVTASTDRRERRIRLSRRGWQAVRFARRTRSRIDARLIALVGRSDYRRVKRVLITCLDALGGVEQIRQRRIRAPR